MPVLCAALPCAAGYKPALIGKYESGYGKG